MSTKDNLKNAFAGESQANRKYTAYAKKADQDKLPGIAKLFRAAAHAETVHALNHLRVLGGIADTVANLKDAAGGEDFEFTKMYPPYVEEAKKEGDAAAERSFAFAMTVEKTHFDLYTAALAAAQSGQDIPAQKFYVCPVCGHTVADGHPDKCPVCGAAKWDEVI
ncbi:MAG: rubrerythrin family protein [Verrucomicrobiota bacterium]|jgi:rubrerythrin|nr:rubrerythrin family protein [Verrucomicrobiota bacterium]